MADNWRPTSTLDPVQNRVLICYRIVGGSYVAEAKWAASAWSANGGYWQTLNATISPLDPDLLGWMPIPEPITAPA